MVDGISMDLVWAFKRKGGRRGCIAMASVILHFILIDPSMMTVVSSS